MFAALLRVSDQDSTDIVISGILVYLAKNKMFVALLKVPYQDATDTVIISIFLSIAKSKVFVALRVPCQDRFQ